MSKHKYSSTNGLPFFLVFLFSAQTDETFVSYVNVIVWHICCNIGPQVTTWTTSVQGKKNEGQTAESTKVDDADDLCSDTDDDDDDDDDLFAFSALTLLLRQQEVHAACESTSTTVFLVHHDRLVTACCL